MVYKQKIQKSLKLNLIKNSPLSRNRPNIIYNSHRRIISTFTTEKCFLKLRFRKELIVLSFVSRVFGICGRNVFEVFIFLFKTNELMANRTSYIWKNLFKLEQFAKCFKNTRGIEIGAHYLHKRCYEFGRCVNIYLCKLHGYIANWIKNTTLKYQVKCWVGSICFKLL